MPYGQLVADTQIDSYGATLAPSSVPFRNRIINGSCVIDQRNSGASVTASGSYPVDRFQYQSSGSFTLTWQQSSTAPAGFTKSISATVTASASVGSGDYAILTQRIEGFNIGDLGFGAVGASTVTLSFWVRSSVTGTYTGVINNDGSSRSYPFTYTISSANTWEQKSITIAGDTSGTWLTNNGVGFQVRWSLGVGSTYAGTSNSWSSSTYFGATGGTNLVSTGSATFYITGVQLEKGSTATSFDYRPYGTELALCERYYYRVNSATTYPAIGSGVATNATTSRIYIQHPVTMRAGPTGSFGGTITVWNSTNAILSSIANTYSSPVSSMFELTSTGGSLGGGQAVVAYTSPGLANYFDFSAEL